jgi:hypothetical protein
MSKGKTAKSSNADVTPRRAGRDEATQPEATRRRRVDALLDAALEATFPASDPIAIEVDR